MKLVFYFLVLCFTIFFGSRNLKRKFLPLNIMILNNWNWNSLSQFNLKFCVVWIWNKLQKIFLILYPLIPIYSFKLSSASLSNISSHLLIYELSEHSCLLKFHSQVVLITRNPHSSNISTKFKLKEQVGFYLLTFRIIHFFLLNSLYDFLAFSLGFCDSWKWSLLSEWVCFFTQRIFFQK